MSSQDLASGFGALGKAMIDIGNTQQNAEFRDMNRQWAQEDKLTVIRDHIERRDATNKLDELNSRYTLASTNFTNNNPSGATQEEALKFLQPWKELYEKEGQKFSNDLRDAFTKTSLEASTKFLAYNDTLYSKTQEIKRLDNAERAYVTSVQALNLTPEQIKNPELMSQDFRSLARYELEARGVPPGASRDVLEAKMASKGFAIWAQSRAENSAVAMQKAGEGDYGWFAKASGGDESISGAIFSHGKQQYNTARTSVTNLIKRIDEDFGKLSNPNGATELPNAVAMEDTIKSVMNDPAFKAVATTEDIQRLQRRLNHAILIKNSVASTVVGVVPNLTEIGSIATINRLQSDIKNTLLTSSSMSEEGKLYLNTQHAVLEQLRYGMTVVKERGDFTPLNRSLSLMGMDPLDSNVQKAIIGTFGEKVVRMNLMKPESEVIDFSRPEDRYRMRDYSVDDRVAILRNKNFDESLATVSAHAFSINPNIGATLVQSKEARNAAIDGGIEKVQIASTTTYGKNNASKTPTMASVADATDPEVRKNMPIEIQGAYQMAAQYVNGVLGNNSTEGEKLNATNELFIAMMAAVARADNPLSAQAAGKSAIEMLSKSTGYTLIPTSVNGRPMSLIAKGQYSKEDKQDIDAAVKEGINDYYINQILDPNSSIAKGLKDSGQYDAMVSLLDNSGRFGKWFLDFNQRAKNNLKENMSISLKSSGDAYSVDIIKDGEAIHLFDVTADKLVQIGRAYREGQQEAVTLGYQKMASFGLYSEKSVSDIQKEYSKKIQQDIRVPFVPKEKVESQVSTVAERVNTQFENSKVVKLSPNITGLDGEHFVYFSSGEKDARVIGSSTLLKKEFFEKADKVKGKRDTWSTVGLPESFIGPTDIGHLSQRDGYGKYDPETRKLGNMEVSAQPSDVNRGSTLAIENKIKEIVMSGEDVWFTSFETGKSADRISATSRIYYAKNAKTGKLIGAWEVPNYSSTLAAPMMRRLDNIDLNIFSNAGISPTELKKQGIIVDTEEK